MMKEQISNTGNAAIAISAGYADVVCWWSGGVTSAVAIWLAISLYGSHRIRIIFIDTFNEDADTYRFKDDCERWYGIKIETISGIGENYKRIQDVWFAFRSLNVATGAICSTHLKQIVRENWQKENQFTYQVFGFDISESKRAIGMKTNNPSAKSIFPLLFYGMSKKDCMEILKYEFIAIPLAYWLGFHNNNCLKTGCVQGGIGYWQKMKSDFYFKFLRMAVIEHQLTRLAGHPVTMLKDQGKAAAAKAKTDAKANLVFLVKNPDYPELKCIDDFPQMKVQPLFECNGFCSSNDLERNPTEKQLNYADAEYNVA